jgi:hypothetical protein
MTAASSTIPQGRARGGSVVGLADQRQRRALILLAVVPGLLLFGFPGVPFAVLCGLVVAALTFVDVAWWADAALASRRMTAGLPPAWPAVDYGVGRDWTRALPASVPYREIERCERLAHGSPFTAKQILATHLLRRARWAAVSALACTLVVALAWPGMRRPDDRFFASIAQSQGKIIRLAASSYLSSHPDTCPTVDMVAASGKLEADFPTRDPWGTPYGIACKNTYEVTVTSAGPDRTMGTADDVPAATY